MKITRIGPSFPLLTASTLGGGGGSITPSVGSGLVPVSTGSNSWAWGSNVARITADGSNVIGPFINFAAGSNVIFAVSSNTINIASTGGSVSYGSNSNQVSYANAPGASTGSSRADHVHLGVTSVAHSSNTYSGPVILTASGTLGITSPTPGTYNLSATGGSGGGGGGGTIRYPPLKASTLHATYGDDFATTSLDAKWTAHSTSGSFTTSHVQTQEQDGSWVSFMFASQNGRLYETTTNTDQEWVCCMQAEYNLSATGKVGIAILDSSGNGVAVIAYNDNTCYLMEIAAYIIAGANQQILVGTGGVNVFQNTPVWLRITRSGNVFDGYLSYSGRAWDFSGATITKTITADRFAFGAFNDGGNLLTGRLLYEFVDRIV